MKGNVSTYILFYLFGLLHTLSYTTSVLFSYTLDMQRGVFGLILLMLYYKYLDRKTIYLNIAVLYISILVSLFSFNYQNNVIECIGFVLYYNVAVIFWKVLGARQLTMHERLVHFYSFAGIPLLIYISPMIFSPSYINLDFYSDPILEQIGLKSRTVGWASACCIPMVFIWTKREGPSKFISYALLITLVVLVIGSGSRSSIIGSALFILAMIYRQNAKQKIYWAILLIFFTAYILNNIDHLSLSRRAELHRMGVSDDTFRLNLVTSFLTHLFTDFPSSLLPEGLGYDNIQHGLNKFFDSNGFGTHNTYVSIILCLGILSVPLLQRYYKGLKLLYKQNFLYFFIPFLTISVTEDCLGPGQLLYFFFIAILVIQTD